MQGANLGVGVALDVMQPHDRARHRGQAPEGARQVDLRRDVHRRRNQRCEGRRLVVIAVEEREPRALPGRTQVHEAAGQDDAADPGAKWRFATEFRQVFEHCKQAVLKQVFGSGAVIQVGEQIIDGSLRHKLEQIKSKLLQ